MRLPLPGVRGEEPEGGDGGEGGERAGRLLKPVPSVGQARAPGAGSPSGAGEQATPLAAERAEQGPRRGRHQGQLRQSLRQPPSLGLASQGTRRSRPWRRPRSPQAQAVQAGGFEGHQHESVRQGAAWRNVPEGAGTEQARRARSVSWRRVRVSKTNPRPPKSKAAAGHVRGPGRGRGRVGNGADVIGPGAGTARPGSRGPHPATAGTEAAPRTHTDGRNVTAGPSHPSRLPRVPPGLGPRFAVSKQARGAFGSERPSRGLLEASRPPALTSCSKQGRVTAYVLSTGPASPQLNRVAGWTRQLPMLLVSSPDTELQPVATTE